MKAVQNAVGASAACTTRVLVDIQDECEKLTSTAKDYRDPSVEIQDPRSEMAAVLDAIRNTMMNSFAKMLSDAVKMSAWQFNQLLQMRRGQYLEKITKEKNARAICKNLNPSDKFLFGEKLGAVCKNLKESAQLNPLSQQYGRSGYGYRSSSGFRPGIRGRGGRGNQFGLGASAGKLSNERVARFTTGTNKPSGN